MKNVIIGFDEKEAFEKANDYFNKICGFQIKEEKHKKMLTVGMDARNQGVEGIRIKAVISSHGAEVFQDHKVVIEGMEFSCPVFELMEQDHIKKIYTYVLTAGECIYSDKDDIVKQVFSDIWGTAYTDAARDLLEGYITQRLEQEYPEMLGKELFLSDAFGPGYYGMELSQTKDLFQILDAESIGMHVKDSGLMLPQKSCSGLYFVVTNTTNLPHPNCRECIGNHMGCSFCRFRHEHWERQLGGRRHENTLFT